MMSWIDSWHWKISTGPHFQNGLHNTAQIQRCPISTPFHMWVDYDVPNWFLTSTNFYRSPFSKWPPQYRTNSTLSNFNAISYVGRLCLCPELIPDIEKFLVSIFVDCLFGVSTLSNQRRDFISSRPIKLQKRSKFSQISKFYKIKKNIF